MQRQGSHRRFAAGSSAYRPQRRVADKQHDAKRQDAHEAERRLMAIARFREACDQQQAATKAANSSIPTLNAECVSIEFSSPHGNLPRDFDQHALIVSGAGCSTFSRKREDDGGGAGTVKERQTQKGRCPEGFGRRPEGKGGASVGRGRPRKAAREGRPAP